ncbi:hypothetical protein [Thermogymnomonas acidicola]|uniref:hypothetical protein n=1 Tax=Thermogymnomonas acidicola TaxID=399579 RepID=UPI0009461400|nr:hypothetical protein [Thermogymnomonas acidicola]
MVHHGYPLHPDALQRHIDCIAPGSGPPRSREDTPTGGGGALINLYSPEVTGLSVALILSYLLGIVHGITRTSTHGR